MKLVLAALIIVFVPLGGYVAYDAYRDALEMDRIFSPTDEECRKWFDLEADIRSGNLQYMIFGLISIEGYERENQIAKRYGFSLRPMACDMASDDCAHRYNRGLIEHLTARNGPGWFERYEASVDSLWEVINKEHEREIPMGDSMLVEEVE